MDNIIRTSINISELRIGMTVEYNKSLHTVGKEDVKNGFCGFSFKGDASSKNITMVQFAVPTSKGIILR